MTTQTLSADFGRKNWNEAFKALRALLADANDTAQVFRIMRALNTGAAARGYDRLLRTSEGGRIAYQRVELADKFSDAAYIERFGADTVGGAYARFLKETGYSAQGLVAVSRVEDANRDAQHPYMWFGRRTRDVHDIWHILTGYRADDPLGEACLTAFSFAQTGGLGWALIALGSAFRALHTPLGWSAVRAIWEGYQRGRRTAWLPGQDYEALLAEPLVVARTRLGITEPIVYHRVARA